MELAREPFGVLPELLTAFLIGLDEIVSDLDAQVELLDFFLQKRWLVGSGVRLLML